MIQRYLLLLIAGLCLSSGCEYRDRPLTDANDLFERGVSLYEEKSYQQAESLFVQVLPTFEQLGQTYSVAEANRYLGQTYLVEGRPYSALKRFESSLQEAHGANDFRSEMQLRSLIGDAQVSLDDYRDALLSYEAAHKLSAAFNDPSTKAGLEMKMALASSYNDKVDDALRYYQTAFAYYQGNGGKDAAEALRGIGEVLTREGKYDEALSSLSQGRTLIRENEEPILDAQLRMDLALVYKAQGNPNEALQWLRDAANNLRSRKIGREHEVLLLFHIGLIYYNNGQFADGKRYFTEAEGIAHTLGDGIAEGFLELYGVRCDERALPVNQRFQRTERLVQTYQGIGQNFQLSGYHLGEAYSLAQVARLYESVGNLDKAREYYQRALSIEDATLGDFTAPEFHRAYREQLKISEEWVRWYTQLASVLLQTKHPQAALEAVEKYSSRRFFELFQHADIALRHPDLQEQVAEARGELNELRMKQIELSSLLSRKRGSENQRLIADLRPQVEDLRSGVSALTDRIVSVYPNYEPLLRSSSLDLKKIQESIPRGTLVIRFLPASDQLHIFAITRNDFQVKSAIVTREKLLSLVDEYERLLHDPSVYTGSGGEASMPAMLRFAMLSTQLYDYLLRPVDALLEQNLVIIMSPEFEDFPFHTIERQDRNGTVRYLVEITGVDYLPSLTSITFKTSSSPHISQVLALGNPTGKNWSIDYELRDVRSFFKDATILISNDATWDNIRTAKADVLYLSTDFIMEEGTSALGMIALAKPQTPEEIVRVPFEDLTELHAPSVVVLSNQYGQGFGLTDAHALALRINGTSDVFLNAWFSDRKAAKFFSEYFFTHLSNGLAPGDAYRQALLNLIQTRDTNHPHSWGQFFHYGIG
jgi:tetratricopeptide (TPR) repeat protein/CHAT domain-containing protein